MSKFRKSNSNIISFVYQLIFLLVLAAFGGMYLDEKIGLDFNLVTFILIFLVMGYFIIKIIVLTSNK